MAARSARSWNFSKYFWLFQWEKIIFCRNAYFCLKMIFRPGYFYLFFNTSGKFHILFPTLPLHKFKKPRTSKYFVCQSCFLRTQLKWRYLTLNSKKKKKLRPRISNLEHKTFWWERQKQKSWWKCVVMMISCPNTKSFFP